MSFIDDIKASCNTQVLTESVDDGINSDPMSKSLTDSYDDDLDNLDDGELEEDNFDKPESLELSPEEDAEADSIIDIAATPVVLKEILGQESVNNFCESAEFDIAVNEGFAIEGMKGLFTSDVDLFTESANIGLMTEAQFYNKNMVRFTKQARTNQLFEICVQAIARAKGDPVQAKLSKVQQMRRKLKAILRQRYKAPALKKAKEYIQRLKASKAPTIANAAKKLDR